MINLFFVIIAFRVQHSALISGLSSGRINMKKISGLLLLVFVIGCASPKQGNNDLIKGKGITAEHGIVVSAHPVSSEAGSEILRKGGNAIDAAIATEFALAVCYPEAGNIGGGGFMLIRKSDGTTDVIDYREVAPGKAHKDLYLDESGNVREGLSTNTQLASGVPGTVDGMLLAHRKYGSLPFNELIQPAIDLAENGFPLTATQAKELNENRKVFLERNDHETPFVRDSLWKEGDILVQKDLARSLERIRDNGHDGFYAGETATLIVDEMKRGNGIITAADLADYKAVSRNSISSDYRGYRIITVPPPSGGGIILIQLLGMTEPFPVKQMGFQSPDLVHLVTEAERRAFSDRAEHYGDPDFMKASVKSLISKSYIKSRMNDFSSEKASLSSDIRPGAPGEYESEETTHYSVADAMGNAVAATTTLNGTFGSSILVKGAGFLLNNEMDDFSVKPGVPNMFGLPGGEINSIHPGKKMLSSMTPVIVEKDGKLFMIVGTPGGSTIPTTVFQVLTNVIDHGMNIQEAVDAPRFHHQWLPDCIYVEPGRLDSTAVYKLERMGHQVRNRASIGLVNAVLISEDGTKSGGADRRGDNASCGY
jgi:gamma-glutamyltranspeptidase/glutathione hydrolase